MLGRIAKLYYEYNLTHQQIADLVGWSRMKVTRALAEARESGVVQISVMTDESIFVDEEAELRRRFDLEVVSIAPAPTKPGDIGSLVTAGAQCVTKVVADGTVVGVGLSETLAAIAAATPSVDRPYTTFVPLQGTSPGLVKPPTPSNIASVFAAGFGGRYHVLAAPVLASSREAMQILVGDSSITGAFDAARQSDVALIGLGGIKDNSSLILQGSLSEEATRELQERGAVGDVNARFFDADGAPVRTTQTDLVIGLTLDEFKGIPLRIAAAAGESKIESIAAAMRGGIINGLITDAPTADALLKREDPSDVAK